MKKVLWHRLLGKLLEELLSPVDISVQMEVPVMSEPPKTDILLLRRQTEDWTPAQLERLPDGIRDSKASHILLEFKYTESLNEQSFRQALGYDYFYQHHKHLQRHEVQTFIISSKKTHSSTLKAFGYTQTEIAGVYCSDHSLLQAITLISLNELSDDIYNTWLKFFASHVKERNIALDKVQTEGLKYYTEGIELFVFGFLEYLMKENIMEVITPEKIMEAGRKALERHIANMTPEERLAGLKPSERVAGLKPSERLAGLKVEEIEQYLKTLKNK